LAGQALNAAPARAVHVQEYLAPRRLLARAHDPRAPAACGQDSRGTRPAH